MQPWEPPRSTRIHPNDRRRKEINPTRGEPYTEYAQRNMIPGRPIVALIIFRSNAASRGVGAA